jgi:hypothetical protein
MYYVLYLLLKLAVEEIILNFDDGQKAYETRGCEAKKLQWFISYRAYSRIVCSVGTKRAEIAVAKLQHMPRITRCVW